MRQCDKIMLLLHENTSVSQVVLAGAFYPNYFTFGQPDEEIATRELAGKDPKTTVVVGGETAALGETGHSVFRQASFQCGQYGTFYFPFVSVCVNA